MAANSIYIKLIWENEDLKYYDAASYAISWIYS